MERERWAEGETIASTIPPLNSRLKFGEDDDLCPSSFVLFNGWTVWTSLLLDLQHDALLETRWRSPRPHLIDGKCPRPIAF